MFLYSDLGMGFRGDYFGFLKIHWLVTFQDVLMVFAIYALVSLLRWDWLWFKSRNWGWALFIILLPLWQAAVEYQAVYLAHRWEYLPNMPLIFGIGLSPLLQMLILPSLAILLSHNIFSNSIE